MHVNLWVSLILLCCLISGFNADEESPDLLDVISKKLISQDGDGLCTYEEKYFFYLSRALNSVIILEKCIFKKFNDLNF